jgi:arylsulfatase A-like enzyme
MRPNVLLVVFDTARADAFAPYGAAPESTPATAQLAHGANGIAHPAMFSTACWTLPAHASLFTGRLPRSAGFATGTPPVFKAAMSAMGSHTLPAALQGAGYDTAGVSANPWVSAASGFDQGFERFRFLETDRNTHLASSRPLDRAGWLLQALRARADDGAKAIEQLLAEWLRDRGRRPFFWFVNLMECHSPYLPPKPYSPYGPVGRIRAARDASRHCTLDALWRVACGGWDIDDGALVRMRAMYDASIRQLDDWLARVLQRFDDAHVLDETIVIVTSDHGENFGESHRFGHTASLDNRLLHVPLVASGPVALDFEPVSSLADVPGVLTRALEVDADFLDDDAGVPGVAVAQMDAVGTKGDPRVDAAIHRWGLGDEALEIACTSFVCATDGAVKLVRRLGVERLFDLTLDPLEEQPLTLDSATEATYSAPLGALRRALDLAEADERLAADAPGAVEADAAEVAALEEQMRLLGYL